MGENGGVSQVVINARAADAAKKAEVERVDAKNARRRKLKKEQAEEVEKKKLVEAWDTDANYERDMEWAYNNAMNKLMEAKDAPSGPAWMICEFAQEDAKGFMQMFAKMVEKRDKHIMEEAAMKESRQNQFEFIDTLKEEYSDMTADGITDLLDNDRAFIETVLESRGYRMVPA